MKKKKARVLLEGKDESSIAVYTTTSNETHPLALFFFKAQYLFQPKPAEN